MTEQIHSVELQSRTGATRLEVGKHFPFLHGHWSGGPPDEGGVWHDGKKGAIIIRIISAEAGSGVARCNDLKPNGELCEEIGNVQVLP